MKVYGFEEYVCLCGHLTYEHSCEPDSIDLQECLQCDCPEFCFSDLNNMKEDRA